MLVALLLAGAQLATRPALAGGLPLLIRDRIDGPFAVLDPGTATPAIDEPQEPVGTDASPDPVPGPADEADPPSFAGPGTDGDRQFDPGGDERDRDDRDDRDRDDSSGSGRSGGGDSSGGSSGPG